MILSRAEYRKYTDDWESYDGDVDEALVDAQAEAERITGRKFDYNAAITETLEVYGTVVYPSAIPVSVVDATIVGDGIDFGYWSTWNIHGPAHFATVTYEGGWTPETAPVSLKKVLARVVKARLLKPAIDLSRLPVGTTAVSQIDQSISFKGTSNPGADPASTLLAELRPWCLPNL